MAQRPVILPMNRQLPEAEMEERRLLLGRARAGDLGSLCILWEKYRLRLPLVEARVRVRLPWLQARKTGAGERARAARKVA